MTPLAALQSLIVKGDSETLELKRSTAELKRAGETRCAFLNGEGGKVLIGVGPDGKLVGQDVADITLRDIAAMLGRFEPPARVEMSCVDVWARPAGDRAQGSALSAVRAVRLRVEAVQGRRLDHHGDAPAPRSEPQAGIAGEPARHGRAL
jgi:hypothetical protein